MDKEKSLIDGLIADRSINIFYGDPNAKSLLLVNIATSLVSGESNISYKTLNRLPGFLRSEGIRDRLTL